MGQIDHALSPLQCHNALKSAESQCNECPVPPLWAPGPPPQHGTLLPRLYEMDALFRTRLRVFQCFAFRSQRVIAVHRT